MSFSESSSAYQCVDSSRIACCYFQQLQEPCCSTTEGAVSDQGFLVRLHDDKLAVLTSHQLLPSDSIAKRFSIGFRSRNGHNKLFSLEQYIDQDQVRLITCCGESNGLWPNLSIHKESMCPRNGNFTVLLLGAKFSQDILDEYGKSLQIFSLVNCIALNTALKVVNAGAPITVYHLKPPESVLHQLIQLEKPPDRVADNISNELDWYERHYCTLSYGKQFGMLKVSGSPVVYCETNTGKPWLLAMHVYLHSQNTQFGVPLGHIMELLQSSLSSHHLLHTFTEPPQTGIVPKLSQLKEAVLTNTCTTLHYDNITYFCENFGPELLPNTVVLQAIHLIATDNLLFAQSDLFDTIEIKRSSLKLAWSLCKLLTRSEPEVLSVTINTASEWCTQLSSAEIQQSLTQFCEVLVFCIVPEDDMSLIELWFSCWKCLAELNDIVLKAICKNNTLQLFHKCQECHSTNTLVLQCYGHIMAKCLGYQLRKEEVFEAKVHNYANDAHIVKEQQPSMESVIDELKKLRMIVDQKMSLEAAEPELSVNKLQEQVRTLDREIGSLQNQLQSSQYKAKEMQDMLQKLYQQHYSKETILWEGFLKSATPVGPDFSSAYPKISGLKQFSFDKPSQEQYMFAAPDEEVDGSYSGRYKMKTGERVVGVPVDASTPYMHKQRSLKHRSSFQEYNNINQPFQVMSLDSQMSSSSISYSQQASFSSTTSSESSIPSFTQLSPLDETSPRFHLNQQEIKREHVYKELVKEKFQDFTNYTKLDELQAHLIQRKLLSQNDRDTLQSCQTAVSRNRYFYMNILPSKGAGAYTIFRHCVVSEKEHRGHEHLNDLFCEAEHNHSL